MANYPSADPSFTSIVDGVDFPQAADLNVVYDEVTAIGSALRGTLAHDISLDTGQKVVTEAVQFPATQVASSDANTLDDYAENTWTPTDASGAGLTFSTVEGHYIKIGQLVLASCTLTFPATVDTTQVLIGGLPVAVQASTNNLWVGTAITDAAFNIYAQPLKNTTTLNLFRQQALALTNANLSGKIVRFTLAYRATA